MPTPSRYTPHKLRAIQSFQSFLAGREMPSHPLEIFLEISNVCNLKCAMCSVFSELNPYRLYALKAEERGFLDQRYLESMAPLLSHALLVHCYGYGEPTIHPQFVGILDTILQHEVLVDFFTNGMNLSEELCEFLVDRKIFRVTVSFSGASREDYENMYLNGKFDTVLDGIARLNRIKAAKGSRYPEIEINSIAFAHHIARIVEFVELMAERGVNTIYLKPLHAYETLPVLHSHIAVMRPDVEGKLLDEARRLARRKGINLVDEFSNVATAATPEEEEAVRNRLLWGRAGQAAVEVPIAEFKQIAKTVQPLIPPKGNHPPKPPHAMQQTADTIRPFLDIRAPETPPDVMCSQPFKTFYVNQQGAIRPCCFGFSEAHLGSLDEHSGEEIWNGIGYAETRAAILAGDYPMKICQACLKLKSYPKSDAFWGMVSAYASWYEAAFGAGFEAKPPYAQVYVDTGEGFSEQQSVIQWVGADLERQTVEFRLADFTGLRQIRFDPLNGPAALFMHGAVAYGLDGQAHPLHCEPMNPTERREDVLVFACRDPQFLLAGFPEAGCEKLVVTLGYSVPVMAEIARERAASPYFAQLFIDSGQDYNEAESQKVPLLPSLGQQDIDFELEEGTVIESLRFDPINAAAEVHFHEAEAQDSQGAWHPVRVRIANLQERRGKTLVFHTDDPQIYLAPLPGGTCRRLRFSISYTLVQP